jgi:hypothetical protein
MKALQRREFIISHGGKTTLIFVEKGKKLNAESYCDDILATIPPNIKDSMPDYCFMQDGTIAPSGTNNHVS